MAAEHRRRRARIGVVALPLALLASSALVYQATNAAFSSTTSNDGNTWSTGQVVLSDNDANAAMFNSSGGGNAALLTPGNPVSACIKVTFTGDVASTVKLYLPAADYSGGLGQYLNLTVESGTGTGSTGGASASCTGFTSVVTEVPTTTLDAFATAHTSWSNGLTLAFHPSSTSSTYYRVTTTVQDTNSAQHQSAGARFQWEAQND